MVTFATVNGPRRSQSLNNNCRIMTLKMANDFSLPDARPQKEVPPTAGNGMDLAQAEPVVADPVPEPGNMLRKIPRRRRLPIVY
jgi:hypothetical protein